MVLVVMARDLTFAWIQDHSGKRCGHLSKVPEEDAFEDNLS